MPGKSYVDFAAIKRRVTLEQVLRRYGVFDKLTGGGVQRKGANPFESGSASKSQPFAVNLEKNVWTLFSKGDHVGGNVIDFVIRKEGCGVRDAGLMLAEWFDIAPTGQERRTSELEERTERPASGDEPSCIEDTPAETTGAPARQNPPLTFELKGLDPNHDALVPLLRQWRIHPRTVARFGAGYYSGAGKTMKGRLAVPIERLGVRVGYCGIATDPTDKPFYKYPDKWVHGVEFYNLGAAIAAIEAAKANHQVRPLMLFRSILHVWRHAELGFSTGAAVLGEQITADQLALLWSLDIPHRFPISLELQFAGTF